MELVIYDQETKEEYARTLLDPEDTFSVEWIHSVEKTKWKEKLQVNEEGKIILIETSFKSFGSGVPNQKEGKVHIKDGYIIMTDFYEEKKNYQWIHSHDANFEIKKNNQSFLKTNDIPHHHKAEIIIE